MTQTSPTATQVAGLVDLAEAIADLALLDLARAEIAAERAPESPQARAGLEWGRHSVEATQAVLDSARAALRPF